MSQAQHAQILRQLLPLGGYETATGTLVAKEMSAHALALSQAQSDADRILAAVVGVPLALLSEFERDLGLPSGCRTLATDVQTRLADVEHAISTVAMYTPTGLVELFGRFGITLLSVARFQPLSCSGLCTAPLHTVRSRFRLVLSLQKPVTGDVECIIKNYLPASWRVEILEV